MYRSLMFSLAIPALLAAEGPASVGPGQPAALLLHPPDSAGLYSALQLPPEELETKTGIYTLENGGRSFAARLWLLDHARKSIDIQYYSFARNVTGLIGCEHIVSAADRGVKVRILVDDAAGRLNSYEIKILDAHENIEIRIYNAGLKVGRIDRRLRKLAANSNRVLRRMHNKTMTIDGQAAIIGGRNISDEYFDFDNKYNFRDRDVLLLGKAAASVDQSFEKFWRDELTVKAEELSGKRSKGFDVRELFEKVNKLANDTVDLAPLIRAHVNAFPAEIAEARRQGRFYTAAAVSFVSDEPGKNEDRPDRKGGRCTDTITALIRSARHSLEIQSPYLITMDDGKQLLRETVQRGVKVRVLTNSLASTDNYEAFSGYQRDRKGNLGTGIELHEFRPDAGVRFDLMIPDLQAKLHYEPVYGLHSKTMVIDEEVSVTGSYNLDPRSANYNTECIVVIRSREGAKKLLKHIEEEFLPKNSWPVTPDFNPDSKASLKKRIKAFSKRIFPKKLL